MAEARATPSPAAPAPAIAVVIPAWNRLDDTVDCVRSLLATGYAPLRVTVVDNGSGPGFSSALLAACPGPELEVVRSEVNLGFTGGVNLGLRRALEAAPDYILLLNNDTLVDREALARLVQAAETHQEFRIFSPLITFADRPDTVWFGGGTWDPRRGIVAHAYDKRPVAEVPAQIFPIDWANGCALFAAREVVETVGLLDPSFFALWEEVEWCYRAARRGYRCALQPAARIAHKVSATFGGRTSYRYIYFHTRNRLLFMSRSAGRFRAALSTLGQLRAAVQQMINGVLARDRAELRVGVAMFQANLDMARGRVGLPRLWWDDS